MAGSGETNRSGGRLSDGWGLGEYLRMLLRPLSGRRKSVGWLRGMLWGFTLAAGAAAFVGWLDLLVGLPGALRMAGLAGAALGGAALLIWTVRQGVRGATLDRIAKDVDRAAGSGGQVSAALGLDAQSAPTSALGLGLAGMALRQAEKITNGVKEDQVEPLSRAGKAFLGAAALVLALALVALLWPNPVRTEWLRLADPWGDHPPWSRYVFKIEPGDARVLYGGKLDIRAKVEGAPVEQLDLVVRQPDGSEEAMPMFEERDRSWRAELTGIVSPLAYWARARAARSLRYRIQVINTPQIEKVSVRIAPPPYTQLPPTEGPAPQAGIAGVKGTEVRITVQSNRPLSRGEMLMTPAGGGPQKVEVQPTAGARNTVIWTFPIRWSGTLSLSVVDEAGERSTTPVSAAVVLLKDERPTVRILAPKARSFATPDIALPVKMEAEDDYGISRLELYRSLNGTRFTPETKPAPDPPRPRLDAESVLDLKDYKLQPGDVISLFAHVADNDPDGPKGGESQVATVTIISRELYDELLRSTKEAADLQEKYDEAARRIENLSAEAEKLREAAARETGESPSPELRKKLEDLAAELRDASEKTSRAADQEPLFALDSALAEPMRDLAKTLSAAAGEIQNASRSPSTGAAREGIERGLKALGQGKEEYNETVEKPLGRFMRAFSLLELEENFIELSQRQDDLAQRTSNLKGQDGTDDPTLRVRMKDLQEEQEQTAADLKSLLAEIREGAEGLPWSPDFDKLCATAKKFAEDVEKSRALPAMGEAAAALRGFGGTEGNARATEASETLKKFIGRCHAQGDMAGKMCALAFEPKIQEAARRTLGQMMAMGSGMGEMGIGSGRNGYSMRRPGMKNVGVYGPASRAEMESREGGGREASQPLGAAELPGGDIGTGIKPEDRAAVETAGAALRGVPPQQRESVRAYFKRVADEASAGVVLEEPPPEEKKP